MLKVMGDSLAENVDRLYASVRKSIVAHLSSAKQGEVLKKIYGPHWDSVGVLPQTTESEAIRKVLASFQLSENMHPLVLEEYRRLENALSYQRRVLCLDMDGLLIEHGLRMKEMAACAKKLRGQHAVVVSTAAPTHEAKEMLYNAGLSDVLPVVFGDLADRRGKKYAPVAQFFGYAHPEKRLVAVGHSAEDTPADIDIPFINLGGSQYQRVKALETSVAQLEKPYAAAAKRRFLA